MNLIEAIDNLTRTIEAAQMDAIASTPLAELTERQLFQLEMIGQLKNPTAGELAKAFKVSKPSVTAIIDRFTSKDLVRRVAEDQDRRTMHIHLTEKGESLVSLHSDIHRQIGEKLTACLSDNEASQLQQLLKKILSQSLE